MQRKTQEKKIFDWPAKGGLLKTQALQCNGYAVLLLKKMAYFNWVNENLVSEYDHVKSDVISIKK